MKRKHFIKALLLIPFVPKIVNKLSAKDIANHYGMPVHTMDEMHAHPITSGDMKFIDRVEVRGEDIKTILHQYERSISAKYI